MKMRIIDDKKNMPILVKATSDQKKAMQSNADKYAGGNLSKWMRFASVYFIPSAEHLETSASEKYSDSDE